MLRDAGAPGAADLVRGLEVAVRRTRVAEGLAELARLAERASRSLPDTIVRAADLCTASLRAEGKILACGNGGSAADAAHFVAELVGRMRTERAPLAALSLAVDPCVVTCIGNDYGYDALFERQVRGLGRRGDVLVAISTSGRSENVLRAIEAAWEMGIVTIVLTGAEGDPRLDRCDVTLRVPSRDTARVQEIHTATLHALCEVIEDALPRQRANRLEV